MNKEFEYTITGYPAESLNQVVMFCSADGECSLSDVPRDQIGALENLLNERGREGWELVHIAIGSGGFLAFWKREVIQ